jgi:hypothetical protein
VSLALGCGGSTPPPESVEPQEPASAEPAAEPKPEEPAEGAAGASGGSEGEGEGEGTGETEKRKAAEELPEPKFTDGMSVADAMAAIPMGMPRENIDEDALGAPLRDIKLYEPCKLGQKRVKLKVAVWNGKAVGIDVTVTPKSDKVTQCIREQISRIEWRDKVRSLNVIEYGI